MKFKEKRKISVYGEWKICRLSGKTLNIKKAIKNYYFIILSYFIILILMIN